MSNYPVNMEALEILDAIDRRGSFAKAAEELNKATSALSYGVQKLEERLSLTVFRRQGRRSVLTPAGRLLLDEGREILNASQLLAEKAKELATGWEPRLRISVEAMIDYSWFFPILETFLQQHDGLEVDISESVLSGGWDALEQDRVDLVVGAPGPVPLQKGFRAVPLPQSDMLPVIAGHHPLAPLANNSQALAAALPTIRRVVSHDTSTVNIARSAGLSIGKRPLYVQTIDQKLHAQLAGLGIGHLPRHRIQHYLDNGSLVQLSLNTPEVENFLAWNISNKGKALQALTQCLAEQSK